MIYIELKRVMNLKESRITYGIILFLTLVYIYFQGGFVPYTIFYIAILLPLLSIAHAYASFAIFKYSEYVDKHFFIKGDSIKYSLKISNESAIFFPYIEVKMFASSNILCAELHSKKLIVPPFSKKKFEYDIELKFRGKYDIGIEKIEISDFLNLVKFSYFPDETKHVVVYPRVSEEVSIFPSADSPSDIETISNRNLQGNDVTANIREYSYGDSLKKIHWKLTSKYLKLMTRETVSITERNALIILDLAKNKYDLERNILVEDKLIETLVSEIHSLLKDSVKINLLFYKYGYENIEASNMQDFNKLYDLLAEIEFDQTISSESIIDYLSEQSVNLSTVIFFSASYNPQLISKAISLKHGGSDIIIFMVPPIFEGNYELKEALNTLKLVEEEGIVINYIIPSEIAEFNDFSDILQSPSY